MTPTVPDGIVPANWLDTSALTDPTRCPSCARPLAGRRCPSCALDVSGPAGRELWRLSGEAARILGRRSEVIAAMRVHAGASMTASLSAPLPLAPPVSTAPGGPSFTRPGPSQPGPAHTGPATGPGHGAPARAAPRAAAVDAGAVPPLLPPVPPGTPSQARPSWALQTILQVVGAVLLAAAGLVFTVFAWGHLSLGTRGAILVAITAAVFVGAVRAARANLRSAPEVIAALGSSLVVLDAWVLWTAAAGGAGGSGGGGGRHFASALLVSAAVLVPLGRILRLMTATVVGLISLTAAPAVLAMTIGSVQAAACLLALSAALCLASRWLIDSRDLLAAPPVTAGPVTLARARAVVGGLSPYYLGGAAIAILSTLVQDGPGHTVGPLVAVAVVSGPWAAAESGLASRNWSGAAGCALVLSATAGAASFADLSVAGAPQLTVAWLLPLGAVVGFAAAVLVLRALPHRGSAALRAGWRVVLMIGLVPAVWTAVLVVAVMVDPGLVRDPDFRISVLHVLAGLLVLSAARPVIHLLGGRMPRGQIVEHPLPAFRATSLYRATGTAETAGTAGSAEMGGLGGAPGTEGPFGAPRGPGGPAAPGSFAPDPARFRALVDHPASASVVASVFVALGIPLTMPGPSWTVVALLGLATLVALARSPLTDWLPTRTSAGRSPSATPPTPSSTSPSPVAGGAMVSGPAWVPAPRWEEQVALRLGALVRGSFYTFCVLTVAVAAILSLVLAAGGDEATSRTEGQGMVAVTFLVAGLLLWIARGWVPAHDVHARINRAALTFISLVISSIGLGILARLAVPLDDLGWYAAPLPLVLILIALGIRDMSARALPIGHAKSADPEAKTPASAHDDRAGRGPGGDRTAIPDRLAALGAAAALCAPGLLVSAVSALRGIDSAAPFGAGGGQAPPVAILATVLVALTVVLTWQLSFSSGAPSQRALRMMAAALVPFTGVLALLSLRAIALAAHLDVSRVDWLLAVLGLLVVMIIWIGARTSGAARASSEVAIVTLAAITVMAVVGQGDPRRITVALSICAVGALAYAVASAQPRWGWLALGLGACASWVSLAGSGLPPEAYTAPGGLVVVATGSWQLWRSLHSAAATERTSHAIRLVLAGLAVLVLPSVLLAPGDAGHSRAVVVIVVILWLGGTAWLLTFTQVAAHLRELVTGMTLLALAAAIIGVGGHAVGTAARTVARAPSTPVTATAEAAPGLATGLWTAAAALLTAGLAVLLTRVAFRGPAPLEPQFRAYAAHPRVWALTVCAALLTAPAAVLLAGEWFTSAPDWVAGSLVAVWGVTALLGTPPGTPRVQSSHEFGLRAIPALASAYVMALIGAAATSSPGTEASSGSLVELLVLAGVFVAIVTVRAAQVAPTSSTWSTVVFGVLATTVPLTLDMIAEPSGPRITVATVTAAVWLVLGVRMRWQAPVACGTLALLLQAVVLAGPPALAAMSGMLGWIALAGVGGILLALGLTYEKQIATARKVLRRYSELR